MDNKIGDNNLRKIYKTRKWRWIIYVAIPAATLLFFLLFLTSTKYAKYEVTVIVAPTSKSLILRNSNLNSMKEGSLKCHTKSNNNCAFYCTGDVTPVLNDILAKQQTACNVGLQLILTDCFFPDDGLTPDTFVGAYNLDTLTIKCTLKYIAKKAFEQPVLANLTQLRFINTTVKDLSGESFKGLQALKVLHLINCDVSSISQSKNVLQPLATTLTQLKMTQKTNFNENDPKIWFGNIEYERLISIDLSHNRFPHILSKRTFKNFKAVQNLYLDNCEIAEIELGTFLPLAATLKYLNLKNNNLKQLDVSFLKQVSVQRMSLELAFNDWHCSCNIDGLINAIQQQSIGFTEIPKCKTPNLWLDWNLVDVTLTCGINFAAESRDTKVEGSQSTEDSTSSTVTSTIFIPTAPYKSSTTPSTEDSTISTVTSTSFVPTAPHKPSTTPSTTPTTAAPHACANPILATPFPNLFLSCTRRDGSIYYPYVYETDAVFEVKGLNETSVEVVIENSYFQTSVNLLYFDEGKNSYITTTILESATITKLIPSTAYTFCLAPLICVSPFNCRSHFVKIFVAGSTKAAWLTSADKVLFISLTILGASLLFIIAGIAMYFTLRWRPIWLKGNKRVMRLNSRSPKVVLRPKPAKFQSMRSILQNHSTVEYDRRSNSSDFTFNYERSPIVQPHTTTKMGSSTNAACDKNEFELDVLYEKIY